MAEINASNNKLDQTNIYTPYGFMSLNPIYIESLKVRYFLISFVNSSVREWPLFTYMSRS